MVDCWCGSGRFVPFGPDYAECVTCGTLVSQKGLSSEQLQVVDDERDYYGKQYWLDHQERDLALPGFEERVRNDLPERNLHWLRALLKYRLPSAKVMELGCAHGSFVALMQQAGYEASGVEMSPWVVAFARETFGIEVQKGPVEALANEPGSLDVIAMMDVMEHLPDPVATMSHCLDLLKPDGLLLVQMPNFQEGMKFEELVSSDSIFLSQLKSDEHLYLYSKRSATEFFHRLGADHISFEPAIFAHYDMFFVVSRMPLQVNTPEQIDAALTSHPQGRIVQAMLDMKERYDQAPILQEQMAAKVSSMQSLYERVDEMSNARNLALAQLEDMRRNFDAVEKDRAARGEVINAQGSEISQLQAEVDLRLKELHALFPKVDEWKNLANLREAELIDLRNQFSAVESDRIARGAVIEEQGRSISEIEAQTRLHLANYPDLRRKLDESLENLQNATGASTHSDGRLTGPQQQVELIKAIVSSADAEVQELKEALRGRDLEVQRLTSSLEEGEKAHVHEVNCHKAEQQELARRWWWKLGKLIRAL